VWALAAIIYEAVVGTVPFMGVNGPSILLEILTKDPKAPSVAAANAKHPVPPTLDRVMTHAFKKQAAQRIGSVGALADAVGQAYGLTGNHQEWAKASEADLQGRIAAKLPELMKAVAPAGPANVADSFFGESDALDTFDSSGAPSARPPAAMQAGGYAPGGMHHDVPMGLPKRGGNIMLFVAVGAGALVLGVLIAVVLVLLK
jgi:serine/threonine-protein kinase